MLASVEQRYLEVEELLRDGSSVLARAFDAGGLTPVLIRRLVTSRRNDDVARAGLIAEAEYSAQLDCARCPRAELIPGEDGEILLRYQHAGGVELDRALNVIEVSGRLLAPHAVIALISEVLHAAAAIQKTPPPVREPQRWGHGEIRPRTIMLGTDGFARLYELRLAAAGYRSIAGPATAVCRAPELAGGTLVGSAAGDVYAIGAVMALALFGPRAILPRAADPLIDVVRERATKAKDELPPALIGALLRAVDPSPEERFASPEAMRQALRAAVSFDYDLWRDTLVSLASLAEELALDTKRDLLSAELLAAHPRLFRDHDDAGIDQELLGHEPTPVIPLLFKETPQPAATADAEAVDGGSIVARGDRRRSAPPPARRAQTLPRRVAVVPRRVPRATSWIAPPPSPKPDPVPERADEGASVFDPDAALAISAPKPWAVPAAVSAAPTHQPPPSKPMSWWYVLSIAALIGLLIAGSLLVKNTPKTAAPNQAASH